MSERVTVVTDAVLWLAKQPITLTVETLTITGLRERGVVRPRTLHRRV